MHSVKPATEKLHQNLYGTQQRESGITLFSEEELATLISQSRASEETVRTLKAAESMKLDGQTNLTSVQGRLCMKFAFVCLSKQLSSDIDRWPNSISNECLSFFYQLILEDNRTREPQLKRIEILETDMTQENLLILFSIGVQHLKALIGKWDPRYRHKILNREEPLRPFELIRDALEHLPEMEEQQIKEISSYIALLSELHNASCPLKTISAQMRFYHFLLHQPFTSLCPEDKLFVTSLCFFNKIKLSTNETEEEPFKVLQKLTSECQHSLTVNSLSSWYHRTSDSTERDFDNLPPYFPFFFSTAQKMMQACKIESFNFFIEQMLSYVYQINSGSLEESDFRQRQWLGCGDLLYIYNFPLFGMSEYKEGCSILESFFLSSPLASHVEAHAHLMHTLFKQSEGEYVGAMGWIIYKTWWYAHPSWYAQPRQDCSPIDRLIAWHGVAEKGWLLKSEEFESLIRERIRALHPEIPLSSTKNVYNTLQSQWKKMLKHDELS